MSRTKRKQKTALQPGYNIWLPLVKIQGSVVLRSSVLRSYLIGTEDGGIRGNRAHLCPIHHSQ